MARRACRRCSTRPRASPHSAASGGIVVALMTDARFSGGSVGLVIGHVGPEAALGGPIAFIEDGDEIIADLNSNELNCPALGDPAVCRAQGGLGQGGRRTTAAFIPTAARPTPACFTAHGTRPCPRPAVAACIPTARSGFASRARPSGQVSCRRTSTGWTRSGFVEAASGLLLAWRIQGRRQKARAAAPAIEGEH